ncbi:hypothetical protein BURPSS13_F0251 [Burkholderia pseudomallei S13]|nr:hypothetical protein BURPSS13_F0251 [Burkholderia pseudomallei S13]
MPAVARRLFGSAKRRALLVARRPALRVRGRAIANRAWPP